MTTPTDETAATTDDVLTLIEGGGEAAATTTEGEADATLLDSAGKAEGEAEDKPGAPEKYEIALADGQAFDAEAMEVVEPVLRELGLTNDQANKLAVAWPQLQEKMASRFAAQAEAAQVEELNRLSVGWEKDSVADKEIGGAPEVMGPKMKLAAAARDKFASPDLVKLLNATKLGNHPEVLRLFVRVGQAISEGSFVRGDQGAARPKADYERLYPHMTNNSNAA